MWNPSASEKYGTSDQSYAIPVVGSGDCPQICNRSESPECSHLRTTGREQGIPCWVFWRHQLVHYSHKTCNYYALRFPISPQIPWWMSYVNCTKHQPSGNVQVEVVIVYLDSFLTFVYIIQCCQTCRLPHWILAINNKVAEHIGSAALHMNVTCFHKVI